MKERRISKHSILVLRNGPTLLNNRLHSLMQMMMHMLLHLCRLLRLGLKLLLLARALEPRSIHFGLGFSSPIIVVDVAVLSFLDVLMLLGEDFGVFEGLDCGVVVVLMFFLLNKLLFAGFVLLFDVYVFDGGRDFRVDCCVFYIAAGGGGCGGSGGAVGSFLALWLVWGRVFGEEFADSTRGVLHGVDVFW